MADPWLDMWNERFGRDEYAYGESPNHYLKEQLDKLKPGSILFAAEGEGRNAVYAAKSGWAVSAFDISVEGQKKAIQLAARNKVTIDYKLGELSTLGYQPGQFDAVALIYAHFPSAIKAAYLKTLATFIRQNGVVIVEAFSKSHLEYIARNEKVGGPRDLDMLYSMAELNEAFPDFDAVELVEKEIDLREGDFHQGAGSVIQFLGRKR